MKKTKILFILIMSLIFNACEDCECVGEETNEPIIPISCDLQAELNFATGIDIESNVIEPAFGAVDPFWNVLNKPPVFLGNPTNPFPCTNSALNTLNGSAYVMNFSNLGNDAWVNQTGSTTIAPFDLGPNGSFNCNNATNIEGETVPFIFERSFCVLNDTNVDWSFTFKADDEIYFELVKNNPFSIINTSSTYVWSVTTGVATWSASNLQLSSGSYSIRGYLKNTGSVVLGFSFLGNIIASNGDLSISNNYEGCCENNVISILNILDLDCDTQYNNSVDQLGNNWTFNLIDSSNTIISSEVTDANGNIFFSGLPDGTYTVEIDNQTGWILPNPVTVTVSNNQVEILEFFSCTE